MDTDLFGVAIREPEPRPKTHGELMREWRVFLMRNPDACKPLPPMPKPEHIILIGCGKTKLPHAAAAKDLYTGALFRARRRYAEASGRRWWIVSAKHGLLDPEQVVEPYDQRLGDGASRGTRFVPARRMAIEAWGTKVAAALRQIVGATPLVAELHMGADYCAGVQHGLHYCRFTTPVAHMGVGEQLAFYKCQNPNP